MECITPLRLLRTSWFQNRSTENLPAPRPHPGRCRGLLDPVLSAARYQLDGKPSMEADEVEVVAAKRRLPAELKTMGAQALESGPEMISGSVIALRSSRAR
jgi:hypothetical protein